MFHNPKFASGRWWRLAVAAVIVLALVAGMAFWLNRDRRGAIAPPSALHAPAVSPPGPGNTQTVAAVLPSSAPEGVTWVLVGQAAVPVSEVDGPRTRTRTQASGFARTPVGALIGAVQISTRAGYSSGRAIWEPALQRQFVASPDRDALLRLLRDADTRGEPVAAAGELSQVAGFRFISFTDQMAVIGLVRRTPAGGYSMSTLTVQWDDGDWKLCAPPAGHWPAITTTVTDLTGIVAWGAS